MSSPVKLQAQKDQIPLRPKLEQGSERLLIKIGMISKSRPAKLKFGDYATVDLKGESAKKTNSYQDGKTKLEFSLSVINKKGDTAYVEAAQNSPTQDGQDFKDLSVYITTNIDQEDLWVLLMTQTPDKNEFSLKNIYLTNGTDEINFENVIGEAMGKTEVTAPKGIEALMNENAIGALQYYSGGSFSYKKYIWISDDFDDQTKMVLAAVFSSMMEIAGYFEDATITD
jgi:hypothetical protein